MKLGPSIVAAMVLCCAALPTAAKTVDGVEMPDAITVDGQVLHLNGAGLRQVPILGIDIYIAGLYLPAPSHDADAILRSPAHKAVVIHFLHHGSKTDVENSFRKGERINCGEGQCDPAELPNFEKLIQVSPGVEPGDTATYIYDTNRLRALSNGRLIADYPDGGLSHQLLLGFLGQHPPTERLKRQMLGLADE